ncbi:alkylation response protein AidB-like acyl-CoA dehydrogenase [Novosphingobium chloroacetimidivorans]|uniref:Alkylation response protein AidB-like acyl-CoA dehydrogenase n=1 Tax=Novosphingobium chloroacetimidivorans TaxID=1428314 RepID=A0A7W7K8T0_9SPHN|nr:acyl-CoA dehydrogenase [Novosphingobium chloroacetimidivorans]MBB4857613.1 alkylation response protein AidB-like acyl-CoA dehydrogenase [Novosphingobium chloroacetimidivorans]
MNFGLNDDQQMLRDSFARFLDSESSMSRVRQALEGEGFDPALWSGLADLGTFAMRVPEEAGGLAMGTLDAALVLEEAGRTLALGPIAEAILAARLIALTTGEGIDAVIAGEQVATLAFRDVAEEPVQWLNGGDRADLVIARHGDDLVMVAPADAHRRVDETLAANGIAEVDLGRAPRTVLASGPEALALFAAALEEWKLLTACQLLGLAREAVRLAAAYACERKAFGVPIGTFQAISHPLANFITEIEGGRAFAWKAVHMVATGEPQAGAAISLALWWAAKVASTSAIQSLRTFGGYGLTTEYDIHLYNLRAKATALVWGDSARLLEEAGRRLYAGEPAVLPDVGPVSIDFDLGEDARALAAEVDRFFEETLTPELKAHAHYSWDGHHPAVHKKLAEAGLLFPELSPAQGGRGASPYARYAAADVWEEHGWSGHARGTTMMAAAMIDKFGTDELKAEVLTRILAGEAVCSLGYSEPGSGSDVFSAQTKATPDGNGWRIDGTKMFTSGANLADYVLMLCRTNPDVAKHKGLTMFIVPLMADGIEVQPVHTFQDERTNITFYDNVKVPDTWRIGPVDGGVRAMSAALELEHGGGGFAKAHGLLIRMAEDLAREIRFAGKPLIEDPAAQVRLARARAHHMVGEMLVLRSLWSVEEKQDLPACGPMAKVFTSEKFLEDGSDLLDLTAPLSLSKRDGAAAHVNTAYRHAHGTTIYAGTSEIHRSMIAERALGLPRTRA